MSKQLHQDIARGYEVRPAANGGWVVLSAYEAPSMTRAPIAAAFSGYGDLIRWLDEMHEQIEKPDRVAINEQVHTDA